MKTIQNQPDQFAFHVPPHASFSLADTIVHNGGILIANLGAKIIRLTRVGSTGEIHGSGNYRVILASSPVEDFLWDNTGLVHEITNGGEAALRVMGGAMLVKLVNVCFRNRKHDHGDDTGKKSGTPGVKQDWWKQVQQWRDVRDGLVQGGYTVGLIDIGEQKNTAKTPQRVEKLRFVNHGMTSLPTFTDPNTVGKVIIENCPKIDESSHQLKDQHGKDVFWPNQTLPKGH